MNELTTTSGGFDLSPRSLDEALKVADCLSKSTIVPKDYQNNPGNILVAIQWGMEIGLKPMQAMQNIAVINGRPSVWGDALLAIVRASPLCEYVREDVSDSGAICYVKRRGEPEVSREFTVEDAKKAGLWSKSGPWAQYPKRMMQMRARAFALRDVFTDVLKGMAVAEEEQDRLAERDITPAAPGTATGPGSRTAAMKAKLVKPQQPALPSPEFTKATELIAAAINKATLHQAKEACELVNNQQEVEQLLTVYSARVDYLRSQATAESAPHIDTLLARVRTAMDDEALDLILDEGRALSEADRDVLAEQVALRRDEL